MMPLTVCYYIVFRIILRLKGKVELKLSKADAEHNNVQERMGPGVEKAKLAEEIQNPTDPTTSSNQKVQVAEAQVNESLGTANIKNIFKRVGNPICNLGLVVKSKQRGSSCSTCVSRVGLNVLTPKKTQQVISGRTMDSSS